MRLLQLESRISQIDQQKYPIPSSNDLQEDIHPSPTVIKEKSGVSVAKSLKVYPWVSLGCILVPPTGCSEKWRKKNGTKHKQIGIWLPMMSSVTLSNMVIFIYPRRENESFPDLPLQSRCEEYLPKLEVGWTTHSTWKKRLHISTIDVFLLQALWVLVPIGCGVSLQQFSDLTWRIWICCKLNIRSERHSFVCLSAMASSLTWEIIEKHIQWTILMVISFPVVKISLKEWDFQHLAASHPPQQVWKVSNSMESLGELTLNGKLLQDLYTNDSTGVICFRMNSYGVESEYSIPPQGKCFQTKSLSWTGLTALLKGMHMQILSHFKEQVGIQVLSCFFSHTKNSSWYFDVLGRSLSCIVSFAV